MKTFVVAIVVVFPAILAFFQTVSWLNRIFWKSASSDFKILIKSAVIFVAAMVIALVVKKLWTGMLLYLATLLNI
ncbi:hypothetical protein [Vreelandella titanicae]|jgi:hypothetical protein|uniref:hypothetical protein n=1 Tax=Vreelandella titanicae TaxID=664683 RepID=UPI001F40441C|nr:hypothetical protein [Halomonas titanicae]MCE7521292.1 hypothetical protein [Halomonas titanicae]